jgi:adenosylcobinamide-phosphate synthase
VSLYVELSALSPVWVSALALLVALAVDHCWGEPRARLHPVVWMGDFLGWTARHVQRHTQQAVQGGHDYQAFSAGAFAWCVGAALVLLASVGLEWGLGTVLAGFDTVWRVVLGSLCLGFLLKPLLAWAMLKKEVLAVEHALQPEQGGSLSAGRERLSWLVSRDTTQLTESQVRESAIESLAENLNDSVVAPIFWFVLLGLPGAAVYRFANTADAMWGYRGVYQGRNWEWAGKWAAWADDVLSWLPARLTGVLLALVSGALHWGALRTEAARTPSPNSGWPMAAMAQALGVCLHKPGVYVLNASGRAPMRQDTHQAIFYASKVVITHVFIAQAAIILIAIVGLL